MGVFKMKEPINTWTHFIMFLAGIAGLVFLLVSAWGSWPHLITGLIFGLSVITLYGASSLYHWVKTSPRKELILRKFDHMSIYFLIVGTYTPVLYHGLDGLWRWVTLGVVWALSAAGAVLKLWFMKIPRAVSAGLYIALGWFALVPFIKLWENLPLPALLLLLAGGIAYTFGGIVYATKIFNFVPNKFGFHEIFHIFVGLGTVLHFVMIYFFVLPL